MRRILLLITDLEIGGTPTVVRELATRLREPGRVEVEVACLKSPGPVADQLESAGVRVTSFDATSVSQLPSTVRRLRELVLDHSIDTVFSFLVHANTVAAIASRKLPDVRFIQSIQTTQPYPRWHWWLQRLAQQAADKIVVPSPSVARIAREWTDVADAKIVIIPNAVDAPSGAALPLQWQGGSTIHVGFLGRLDPIKRIPDLIHAISLLDSRFALDVYGEGSDRTNIERAVLRFSLDDRITLHGATAKPRAAIEAMHLLVLPSEAEGFGLVLIEAMARGVPVVATDVDGIRDVVSDGVNGLLVPVGSPDLLARAIQRIADDRALRERLIRSGLNTVRERCTWKTVILAYRKLLGV